MVQIFGDYVEQASNGESEYLIINFSPSSIPLQHRWRNNGLSADFLADYLSTFFPGEDDESLNRRAEIKDGVNYIANELLENAMKFNFAPAKHSVTIHMELLQNMILFYVSNFIDPKSVESFQDKINRILTDDPNELFMEQLMNNEEDEQSSGSGLGYLTMINDWNANLAWKFEPLGDDYKEIKFTVMARLPI